jgi:hypothetical protein
MHGQGVSSGLQLQVEARRWATATLYTIDADNGAADGLHGFWVEYALALRAAFMLRLGRQREH